MNNDIFSKLRVSVAGRMFYHLFPLRKQIVLDNIERVFKDRVNGKEKARLAKAFYSHFALTVKELIAMSWISPKRLESLIDIRGKEHLLDAVNQGRGCLMLTGHLGNWELGLLGIAYHLMPLVGPVCVIRRPIKQKWLERKVFQRMQRWGIKRIDKSGAILKVHRALKAKETIIFTIDQHAQIKKNEGLAVDFFGSKAGTYKSLALIAGSSKAPVVPAVIYRENHKHILEFLPALAWADGEEHEDSIYLNTLRYNQILEQMILQHPEQWWWAHRRWKEG
ncbi:lysophospholipid acyltransferase family protein [uncultured Legionella sp.]|uniref:lysophospholipid acyltransferase family protein n=1 Tax=uncultured Legionella sp. TaxID=210934 RepID=UPI002630DBDC|nr:lysophospholipid acyltransferase family protein [uncultured Legionella sp.]